MSETSIIQESMDKLHELEKMILRKKEDLNIQIKIQNDFARANVASNKRATLPALTKRKLFQRHLIYADDALQIIKDLQKLLLENSFSDKIIQMMEDAEKKVKEINKKIDSETVLLNQWMSEIEKMLNSPDEICFPNKPFPNTTVYFLNIDEEEIAEEMKKLEEEIKEDH